MFLHIDDLDKDIYIYFEPNLNKLQLFIPSDDVYGCIPINYKFDGEYKFCFFYYYKYYINVLDMSVYALKYNKIISLKLNKISNSYFNKVTRPVNRFELLKESTQYMPSNKCFKFRYIHDPFYEQLLLNTFTFLKRIKTFNNDLDKMKFLLKWISSEIHHNGSSPLPVNRGALDLYNYSKVNGCSLNCRGLSVLLCELCLCVGLNAKYIICSQKEIKYVDSHVVTVCFSIQHNKWIYLDPSYGFYLTDNRNIPLSLIEFKQNIINRSKMVAHFMLPYKEVAFDFNAFCNSMIKKLYKFASPINIYYKMDNDRKNNLLYLVPDENKFPSLNCTSDSIKYWQ